MRVSRFLSASALTMLSALVFAAAPQAGRDLADNARFDIAREARVGLPRLESRLAELVAFEAQTGAPQALARARALGLTVREGKVRVVVEAAQVGSVRSAIAASGGRVEDEAGGLIQALVPLGTLTRLVATDGVERVRSPHFMRLSAVSGEGVDAIGANTWQAGGETGAGVKVAIIDGGFAGYTAAQASGDLPTSLVTQNFCADGFTAFTEHGTAVAEIVHEVAPGAALYLICIETEVNLASAEGYAKAQDIDIIVHAGGWFNTSRGDGSGGAGTPDAIVADARASGILWVNSGGNQGQEHWSGNFSDPDSDDVHNFAGSDEDNAVFIPNGAETCVALKWDDWPASDQDYDLGLFAFDGTLVAFSVNKQTGTQPPTEGLCYSNTGASQDFFIVIVKFQATATPRFDLFAPGGLDLEYQVAAGSIIEPASSPSAWAVGALCWSQDTVEPYSSQGPTIDGRTKPDIAGPDGVSSFTFGSFTSCSGTTGFFGTSASAPHAAAAAALVKGANPSSTPAQLEAFLEAEALDRGAAGADNVYGAGELFLGPPPNEPPRATDDALTTDEDTPKSLNVLANDTDPDGDPLGVIADTDGVKGSVSCTSAGLCTYTPNANANGADSFTYTVTDGHGGTDIGTVAVTITPKNDPPLALDDFFSATKNTSAATNVLANDSDVDGDALTLTSATDPPHGSVVCTPSGNCTYTPDVDFTGADSFTYTVSDGSGGTDTASVSVSVVLASGGGGGGGGGGGVPPDLLVTKTADVSSAAVGDSIRYTITVSTKGAEGATGVTLTDPLPPGLTAVFTQADRGPGCTGTTTVTCNLDFLIGRQTATVIIIAQVTSTASGELVNTASVTAKETDQNPADNQATTRVTVRAIAAALTSAASHPGPPRLSLPDGASPLRAIRRGNFVEVSPRVSVDEAGIVRVGVQNPRIKRFLPLARGSWIRATQAVNRDRRTSISHVIAGPSSLRMRLRLPADQVQRGKKYLIVVRATDRDGESAKLLIGFGL